MVSSNLRAMASNLTAMASNLIAMASNLIAMASNLIAMGLHYMIGMPGRILLTKMIGMPTSSSCWKLARTAP